VKLDPKNPASLVSLGVTLGNRARLSDARVCFEKALRLNPRNASARYSLGWLASIEGRFEEAERSYRGALEADAKHAYAWASIADLRRMTPADREWLEGVQRLIESGVSPLEEANLRFALGKYFDDIRNFAEAFGEYRRANELKKPLARPYDRAERTAFIADMIHLYTRERLARPTEGASDSPRPVFVIGMMRSGTSLVEQIIAAHPQAAGAGEPDFWNESVHKTHADLRKRPPDAAQATKLWNEYLRILSRHSRDARRVVDKSTWNTGFVGLIHTVFPRARFIYVQRDPIDTCLSCYFQNFANAARFTMDLSDLAHFYQGHHRLVAHWRSVLPEGTLLNVPYAELVADQEAWTRRIIEFIGLEWDARCLEFHKIERPVLTASNWQVRQRIYSSSVGRWQNYRKFIGPLLELRELSP
jgi:tetratricopeptide (TPR) repeat protein